MRISDWSSDVCSSDLFAACKLYPANATTNSAHGVTDLRNLRAVFEAMQRAGMPLLIHGEVTDAAVDIFDREAVFIDRALTGLVRDFPELRIVLEQDRKSTRLNSSH